MCSPRPGAATPRTRTDTSSSSATSTRSVLSSCPPWASPLVKSFPLTSVGFLYLTYEFSSHPVFSVGLLRISVLFRCPPLVYLRVQFSSLLLSWLTHEFSFYPLSSVGLFTSSIFFLFPPWASYTRSDLSPCLPLAHLRVFFYFVLRRFHTRGQSVLILCPHWAG
jgi:hypothetical protein